MSVLPDTSLAAALDIAERLRSAVAVLMIGHGFSPCDYVSIGVAALLPTSAEGRRTLIETADGVRYAGQTQRGQPGVGAEPAMTPAAAAAPFRLRMPCRRTGKLSPRDALLKPLTGRHL